MKKNSSIFAIIGMILAWSGYFLLSKWGVVSTGSVYLAGMLLRGAALVFLTIYILAKGEVRELFKIKNCWYILLIIGILGFLLDLFANIGFKYSSVSTGTALLKTDILMANLAAAVIFKDKLNKFDWLFTFVMLAGVMLTLGLDFRNFAFNPYDLFFILSALAVTANAFLIKGAQQKFQLKSDVIAYYNNLIVFAAFTAASIISSDTGTLSNISIDGKFILLVAAGGIAQSLIYICYYYNLNRYPVWFVKVLLLFVPAVSAVAGVLLYNETLTIAKIIGITAVVLGACGIIIVQKNKRKGVENVKIIS